MPNFETLIGQALADGKSPEDIAKQLSEALNTACKQKEEAEKKAQKTSGRQKLIDEVEKKFWESVKEEKLSGSDAAALAWLIIVNDSEYGKSIEDPAVLKDLFNHIIDILEHAEDSFKIKRGLKDAFGEIAEVFDFGQMFKIPMDAIKSKGTNGGTDRKDKTDTKSDADRIREFLRDL